MKFLYHQAAGAHEVIVEGEGLHYIAKVRRVRVGEEIGLASLEEEKIYHYMIESIGKKEARLRLCGAEESLFLPRTKFHLAWAIVDPKTVEKALPMLNEIGVAKITFVITRRSQGQFRPDIDRLKRILINSCQQCGRTKLMEIEEPIDLVKVIECYPELSYLDFGGEEVQAGEGGIYLVGPEGGFAPMERELLALQRKVGFATTSILRSETAAVALASKILL
ncbi:MAG: 16S rRNA (uracil(1498)-N(3))-methyltransferase [Campylobacterales bacterium]